MSALLNPIFQRGEESVFTLQLERYFRNQGEIQDSPFTRSVLFGEFMDFGDGISHILELSDVESWSESVIDFVSRPTTERTSGLLSTLCGWLCLFVLIAIIGTYHSGGASSSAVAPSNLSKCYGRRSLSVISTGGYATGSTGVD